MQNNKRKLYAIQRQKTFITTSPHKPQVIYGKSAQAFIRRFLQAIRPYDAAEAKKVRLGPYKDGGYVMLDPGRGGTAYSLGISTYAPWDMEMAERGFKIHQYDASISNTPTMHPNIDFHPYFIMGGRELPDNARHLSQVIIENGDTNNYDLILQIDIEGAEWEVFASLDESILIQFKQIIVEFHALKFDLQKLSILEKILNTHTPIHIHYNNNGKNFKYINKFIYQPNLVEISYARNRDYTFTPCNNYFPTPLDAGNVDDKQDIPIGFFDLLLYDFNLQTNISIGVRPLMEIPQEFYNNFTMNERINVQYHYYDDRILGKTIHNTQKIYQSVFRSLENRTFKYYKDEIKEFYDALDDYPIKDKQVLVWGLSGCNCDAIALWKKAAEVYVVDYNLPICDHESVHPLTHNELQNLNIKFDYAISFSSFEHDGLGRYGDPINPDGDLRAMREASNYLKDEGIMLLGVPLGPDCLCWNAHRIYGPVRLPLLLHGWFPLDVYSIYPGVFDEPSGVVRQPLLVLKKCVSKRGYAEKILHLFRSTLSSAHTGKITGTKNYDLLSKILEFILLDRLDGICNNDNCTTKR